MDEKLIETLELMFDGKFGGGYIRNDYGVEISVDIDGIVSVDGVRFNGEFDEDDVLYSMTKVISDVLIENYSNPDILSWPAKCNIAGYIPQFLSQLRKN